MKCFEFKQKNHLFSLNPLVESYMYNAENAGEVLMGHVVHETQVFTKGV